MAIDNLTFAMNVEEQRKKLIKNLKDKGVEIDDKSPLSFAVDKIEKSFLEANIDENFCLVRYYDIDGTVLKDEYVKNGEKPTPPENPSYDSERLVFAGWVDLPETITEPTFALATYKTTSNNTVIDLAVYEKVFTSLTVSLNITGTGLVIDWGDGVIENDVLTHIYSVEGLYTITINGVFTQNGYIFSSNTGTPSILNLYYNDEVTLTGFKISGAVRLKNIVFPTKTNCTFSSDGLSSLNCLRTFYAKSKTVFSSSDCNGGYNLVKIVGSAQLTKSTTLVNCYALESLKISGTASGGSIGSSGFYSLLYLKITGDIPLSLQLTNSRLKTFTITEGVTRVKINDSKILYLKTPLTLKELSLNQSVNAQKIILNEGLESLFLGECNSLQEITIPQTLKGTFPSFQNAIAIKKILIPQGITRFSTTFLNYGGHSLEDLTIMSTTVLTPVSLTNIPPYCKIWINDDVIEEYKTATNWSAHADKMRPLSEKPID